MAQQYPDFQRSSESLSSFQSEMSVLLQPALPVNVGPTDINNLVAGLTSTSSLLGFFIESTTAAENFEFYSDLVQLSAQFFVSSATSYSDIVQKTPELIKVGQILESVNADTTFLTQLPTKAAQTRRPITDRPAELVIVDGGVDWAADNFTPNEEVTNFDPQSSEIGVLTGYAGKVLDGVFETSDDFLDRVYLRFEKGFDRGVSPSSGQQLGMESTFISLESNISVIGTSYTESVQGDYTSLSESRAAYFDSITGQGVLNPYRAEILYLSQFLSLVDSKPVTSYQSLAFDSIYAGFDVAAYVLPTVGIIYDGFTPEDGQLEENLGEFTLPGGGIDPENGAPSIQPQPEENVLLRSRSGDNAQGTPADFSLYQHDDGAPLSVRILEIDNDPGIADQSSVSSRDSVFIDSQDSYVEFKQGEAFDGQATDLSLNKDGSVSTSIDELTGTENRTFAVFGPDSFFGTEDPVAVLRGEGQGNNPSIIGQEQEDQFNEVFLPIYNTKTEPLDRGEMLDEDAFFDPNNTDDEQYGTTAVKQYEEGDNYWQNHLRLFNDVHSEGGQEGLVTVISAPINLVTVLAGAAGYALGVQDDGSSIYLPSSDDLLISQSENIRYLTSASEMAGYVNDPLGYKPGFADDSPVPRYEGQLDNVDLNPIAHFVLYEYGSDGFSVNLADQGVISQSVFQAAIGASEATNIDQMASIEDIAQSPVSGLSDFYDSFSV